MKIYFEAKELLPTHLLDFSPDYICNAGDGCYNNAKLLNRIRENDSDASVYTNSLIFLTSWAYDTAMHRYEIYMRERYSAPFKSIDDLCGGKVRIGQSVRNMYLNGCFGCIYIPEMKEGKNEN